MFALRKAFATAVLPLALVSLSGALTGCKKEAPPVPKQEAPAPEPPVPAPDGLVVEGVIRAPDAIFQSLHTITPLVPERAGPVLADVLHVSRETTEEVDGQKPAYLAVVRRNGETMVVFAVQLKDAQKVLGALQKQGLSRTEDTAQGLSIFEASPASTGPRTQVLGVRRNFLLAATNVATLKELAPFATRTLPTRATPKQDVALTIPQAAMRGPVREGFKAAIEAGTARRKELLAKSKLGGATGPKGAPIGALDALGEYSSRQNERVVSWLNDAGDAHVTLSTVAGALSLKADLDVPDANSTLGKQVASWPVGEEVAALDVPANALIAFAGRSSDAARTEASHDLAEMLSTMWPEEIGAAEKTKIEGFLAAWDKARAETTTGGLLYEGPARLGIVARLGAKDPAQLSKLMKEAFTSLFAVKGVAAGLTKEGIGAPTFSAEKISGADAEVLSLKLPRKPNEKPKPGEPETAEIVWGPIPGGTEVAFVAGVGSRDLFTEVLEAKGDKTLHVASPIEAQIKALGSSLAGLAVVFPSRTVPIASGAPVTKVPDPVDPVVLAIGKGDKGPWLSLDVSKPAVELAGRFAMTSMLGGKK